MHSLFQKAKEIDDSNKAFFISLLGTNLSIFAGLFQCIQSPNPNASMLWLGSVLSISVFPLYFAALFTLRNNLTILPEANSLNTNGIYRISRHPLYLCYIIWYVLQNLICQTWLLLLITFIQIYITIIRARYEEKILEKNFPQYRGYKKTVGWLSIKNLTSPQLKY